MDAAEGCIVQMRTVLVGLLVAILVVAALPVGRAAMDRPTWTTGDFWSYRLDTGGNSSFNGTLRMDVVGIEDVTVGEATHSAYRVETAMTLHSPTDEASVNADLWFRSSDLAPVKQEITLEGGGSPMSLWLSLDPPPEIRWPLSPGATWNAAVTARATTHYGSNWSNSTMSLIVAYEVRGEGTVTVPAGSFNTVALFCGAGGMFPGPAAVEDWSAEVGNAVRISMVGGPDSPSLELEEYRYAGGASWVWTLGVLMIAVLPFALIAGFLWRARRRHARSAPPPVAYATPETPAPEPAPPQPPQPPGP